MKSIDGLMRARGFTLRQTRAGVLGYVARLARNKGGGSVALLPREGKAIKNMSQPVLLCRYDQAGEMIGDRVCESLERAFQELGLEPPRKKIRSRRPGFEPVQFIEQL